MPCIPWIIENPSNCSEHDMRCEIGTKCCALAHGILTTGDWRYRDRRLALSPPAIDVLSNRERHYLLFNSLTIDDLGTEPREIIEYGNVLSPIIDLISYRYEHQLPTIITSNLTPQQISEVYGKRIGDRLKETTEIVPFLNCSYRG